MENNNITNRDLSFTIVEMFENLLEEKDITIKCESESEEGDRRHDDNSARIYGSEYWNLVDTINNFLDDYR